MNNPAPKSAPPTQEVIVVSVEPTGHGAGVYAVVVSVDNHTAGSTVVRTSPRQFAFQHLEPSVPAHAE